MPPVFLSGVHAFSEKQGAPPKALALPALCLEISVLFMRGGQRRCPPSLEARLILGLSWNQFTLPSTSHCLMAHYRPRCNQIIFHPTVLTFLISISWDVNIPLLSQGLKGQSGSRISSWCWFPFSWTHCHVRYPDLPPSLQSPSWKLCEIKLLSVSKLSKPQEQVSKRSFPWVGLRKKHWHLSIKDWCWVSGDHTVFSGFNPYFIFKQTLWCHSPEDREGSGSGSLSKPSLRKEEELRSRITPGLRFSHYKSL